MSDRSLDCGEAKPLDQFPLQNGGRHGRHPLCKSCRAAQERRRYARDKDAIVTTSGDPLLLRKEPKKEAGNVKAKLPNGHKVRILKLPGAHGFAEVRTKVDGDTKKGFAAARFLKRAPD